jgi:dihydrofolate reductase
VAPVISGFGAPTEEVVAMGRVLLELSMSLDGHVAGPDVGPEEPMGRGGEELHEWMFADRTAEEASAFETDHFRDIGALIVGRRMADLGIGPWGEEPTFHAPVFVVTSRPAETIVKKGGTSYVFVTGGIDEALRLARDAAGTQDVLVNGGADVARQYLDAGAVDEVRLHLVPVVLGDGTRLFGATRPAYRLVPTAAIPTPLVTHLTYEVHRPA